MRITCDCKKNILLAGVSFYAWLCIVSLVQLTQGAEPVGKGEPSVGPFDKSTIDLKAIPFKIIYESYRNTDGKENWELFVMNPDGSNPTNLTRTPEVDESSPHVSPDGTKVCFVADEGTGKNKVSNVYYMNISGTDRVKVADNAKDSCWGQDSKTIAYVKGEFERYTPEAYGTKGLSFYNIKSRKHWQHPNKDLQHVHQICWSQDGNWFLATVHGAMGFRHAILAFPLDSTAVFDLRKYGVTGCTPELSLDGRVVAWNKTDWDLCVGSIDLTSTIPRVRDIHTLIKCDERFEVYNSDISSDSQYITFDYGPLFRGPKRLGWNICVGDLNGMWVQVTTDGRDKNPDWMPIAKGETAAN